MIANKSYKSLFESFRLGFEFFFDLQFVLAALLDHLQQLAVLVAHDVLRNLCELLLFLLLALQVLLLLYNDVVFVLGLLYRFGLLCFFFGESSQFLLAFWHVSFRVVLVDEWGEMGREGLNRAKCTLPIWYSLTLSSLLKLIES
jgi:hypothetical protein